MRISDWGSDLGSSDLVVLPRYDLFGQNSLVFDYNLLVQSKQRCEGMLPDNVRVSILPESSIDLSHAYHALHMPDLASFAGGGYPFTEIGSASCRASVCQSV